MKTNCSIRRIAKHRAGLLLLGLLVVIAVEVALGGILAARCDGGRVCGGEVVQVSDVGLGEALAVVP